MVGYVIPFRPQARTRDWDGALRLLRQTIGSILAAEDGELRVFVVSHDLTALPGIEDPRVVFETVEFPVPSLADNQAGQHDRNWKVTRGCQLAAEHDCAWVFVCDADDLVSNRLNGTIRQAVDAQAVMIRHGYEVSARSHRAFRRSDLQQICGSTFALRTAHVFFKSTQEFWDGVLLRQNHKTLEEYLGREGLPIFVPERPLVAYLRLHGENESDVIRPMNFPARVREWLKFGLLSQPFRGSLAVEFGYQR